MKKGYFRLVNSFQLTVPKNYNHSNRLNLFSKKYKEKFYYYNDSITDENFCMAATPLIPCKSYKIKVLLIKNNTIGDCINFLRGQKAIFAGAQGLSLIWEFKKEALSLSKWYLSFNEKKILWNGNEYYGEPLLYLYLDGDSRFNFGGIGDKNCYLLCFCDI